MTTDAAIARRAFGQLWIGASAWALVFGATVAASAKTYVTSFPTEASRHQLAAITGADRGLAVLLGPVSAIDTVGGYTVYKGFVILTTIGAIWALFATTRVLRGEEDSGRWQLLLAGGTRPARATAATLVALGGAVAIVFLGTTLLTLLAGRDKAVGFGVGETVLYGLSITIAPAVFAAVGAVTSQLGRTRRMATGLGMGVFGVTFVIRMIADSVGRHPMAVVGDTVRVDRAHAAVHTQRSVAAPCRRRDGGRALPSGHRARRAPGRRQRRARVA